MFAPRGGNSGGFDTRKEGQRNGREFGKAAQQDSALRPSTNNNAYLIALCVIM